MPPNQPWTAVAPLGPIMRPADAAAYLGYSVAQFYALAAQGELPRPIKIGRGHSGASGVPKGWLDAVIAARAAEAVIA